MIDKIHRFVLFISKIGLYNNIVQIGVNKYNDNLFLMDDSIRILISKKDKDMLRKVIPILGYATISEFVRDQIRRVLKDENS